MADKFGTLPAWLRVFVTSREEHDIKARLTAFKPTELRVDEARNQADVLAYIRHLERKFAGPSTC